MGQCAAPEQRAVPSQLLLWQRRPVEFTNTERAGSGSAATRPGGRKKVIRRESAAGGTGEQRPTGATTTPGPTRPLLAPVEAPLGHCGIPSGADGLRLAPYASTNRSMSE